MEQQFPLIGMMEKAEPILYAVLISAAGVLILLLLAQIVNKVYQLHKNRVSVSCKRHAHGILFGKKLGLIFHSKTNDEGHCIAFGGSGLGKTSAVLIPTLHSWRGTGFIIDISGDISKNVNKDNKLIYEPENPKTIPYNVFFNVDCLKDKKDQNQALEKLAFLLMPDLDAREASANARFFNDEGRKILTATLIALYHIGMDFVEICEKIMSCSYKELFAEIDRTENEDAIKYINSFYGASEQNTAGCKQACDMAITLFATNHYVKNAVGRPKRGGLSFSSNKIEEYNVFFIVSDSKLDLYAPLVHLVTAQAMEFFSNRANDAQTSILFALDEFASFSRLEMLPALRKLRKKKVRIFCLTQSLADVDLVYGHDERKAMLNNFAFKLVLGADDTDTQEYFSKLIGHKKAKRRSVSINAQGQTTTRADIKKYAIEPEELARLGSKLILLYPGGYKKLNKNYYFK